MLSFTFICTGTCCTVRVHKMFHVCLFAVDSLPALPGPEGAGQEPEGAARQKAERGDTGRRGN